MRLLAFLLILAAGAAACSTNSQVPDTDIPEDVLVVALAEAHVAAARSARTGEDLDSLRAVAVQAVGVDTASFNRAVEAYSRHPEALARLYDRVTDHIRLTQDELDAADRLSRSDSLEYAHPDLYHGWND